MFEKDPPIRSKKLRESARGQECTMQSPWCNGNPATVVWCHSNMGIHGKGGSMKAHDIFGFDGCSGCNAWYDDGPGSREEKQAYFWPAHAKSLKRLIRDGLIQVKGAK